MRGMSSTPRVEPISQPEWRSKQSKYPSLPEAGISNGLLVAPSFTGKTTWLSSWILDWYRGAYARIFIFSPNALNPASSKRWTKRSWPASSARKKR